MSSLTPLVRAQPRERVRGRKHNVSIEIHERHCVPMLTMKGEQVGKQMVQLSQE
jgi:hypothetical protein